MISSAIDLVILFLVKLHRMKTAFAALSLIAFLFSIHKSQAQTITPPDITLQTFYTGLSNPIGIYNCGDHRLFVLEQNQGDIEIIDTNGVYIGKLLDLTGMFTYGGERGLLGMAFHPNFAENGYFYINYTNMGGNTTIARYHVNSNTPNVADPASATILLVIDQPYTNHNGGHIAFGADGYLYIGMGDGGSAGDPEARAQNPNELLGKMLRIDVDNGSPYGIPPTNPYANSLDTLPEIWAFGMRNPWQFSFDRETGDLWIADVGQNTYEEIDFEAAGSAGGMNWGWRCYEGNNPYNTAGCLPASSYDFPVMVHTHASGFCSITGGPVYRGSKYPDLYGLYFYSDYCYSKIYALSQDEGGNYTSSNLYDAGSEIVMLGEDAAGEIYVVQKAGNIYKLQSTCTFHPSITAGGTGGLQADSGSAYWWYRDGELITGAENQNYLPDQAGNYYAVVSDGICTRQTNSLDWIVMSGIGGCTYANAVNYNSNAQVDDGSCQFSLNCDCPADLDANGYISVSDLLIFIGQFGTMCNE